MHVHSPLFLFLLTMQSFDHFYVLGWLIVQKLGKKKMRVKMLKPMLLTDATEIPVGKDWLYEPKYDGFRCILEWESEPILKSRNGKILNLMFPEIINYCHEIYEQIQSYLPLTLDRQYNVQNILSFYYFSFIIKLKQ